jgi:hypothetical protein
MAEQLSIYNAIKKKVEEADRLRTKAAQEAANRIRDFDPEEMARTAQQADTTNPDLRTRSARAAQSPGPDRRAAFDMDDRARRPSPEGMGVEARGRQARTLPIGTQGSLVDELPEAIPTDPDMTVEVTGRTQPAARFTDTTDMARTNRAMSGMSGVDAPDPPDLEVTARRVPSPETTIPQAEIDANAERVRAIGKAKQRAQRTGMADIELYEAEERARALSRARAGLPPEPTFATSFRQADIDDIVAKERAAAQGDFIRRGRSKIPRLTQAEMDEAVAQAQAADREMRARTAARARARAASARAAGLPTRAELVPSKAAQRAAMKQGARSAGKLARKALGPLGYGLGALGIKEAYEGVKSGELDPSALLEALDPLFLASSENLASGDQEAAELFEMQRQAAIDSLAGPDFLTTDEDVELANQTPRIVPPLDFRTTDEDIKMEPTTTGQRRSAFPMAPRNNLLAVGARGSQVRDLNENLQELGLIKGGFTDVNKYTPQTRAAVMKLQQDAKIAVDGIVGPDTREALREAMTDPDRPVASDPKPAPELTAQEEAIQESELTKARTRKGIDVFEEGLEEDLGGAPMEDLDLKIGKIQMRQAGR